MSSPQPPGSDDPIDTSRVIEIEISPARMRVLTLILLVCIVVVVGMSLADPKLETGHRLFLWFVAAIFGLVGTMLWRRVAMRRPVITIAPHGLRDERIAPEFIPWAGIQEIRPIMDGPDADGMLLTIDAATEKQLSLTRRARFTRRPAGEAGVLMINFKTLHNLCVDQRGLTINFNTLVNATVAYAEAAERRERAGKAPFRVPSGSGT